MNKIHAPRMRAASSNARARAGGRCHVAYRVGPGQLWARPNRASYPRSVFGRSLPALALALAALAAVMLPIGISRHCGTTAQTTRPARCTFVEDTMRQMPRSLRLKPCDLDQADARSCIAALADRDCADAAKSLDVLALMAALDRVDPCRRACAATASSP